MILLVLLFFSVNPTFNRRAYVKLQFQRLAVRTNLSASPAVAASHQLMSAMETMTAAICLTNWTAPQSLQHQPTVILANN